MITIDLEALADALAERLAARQPAPDPWMRVKEAAEYMAVSERWLRGHLHEIPHSKVDSVLLFKRRELDEFITNHRR